MVMMNPVYDRSRQTRHYNSPWSTSQPSLKRRKRAHESLDRSSSLAFAFPGTDVNAAYYHDVNPPYPHDQVHLDDRVHPPVNLLPAYEPQTFSTWSPYQVRSIEHDAGALRQQHDWESPIVYPSDSTINQRGFIVDEITDDSSWPLAGEPLAEARESDTPVQPSTPQMQVTTFKNLSNPFKDNVETFIPSIQHPPTLPKVGERNGYVKFGAVVRNVPAQGPTNDDTLRTRRSDSKWVLEFDYAKMQQSQQHSIPPALLADFTLGIKMEQIDRRLLNFYLEAWCSGRTVLLESNSWKLDLGPMFAASPVVRHALLSLAAVYILDYVPSEEMRQRANLHYAKAVRLFEEALHKPEEHKGSNGDALVGAITLLNMLDVVRWEGRRPAGQEPRWLEGARVGAEILRLSDPGHRYYKRKNAQITQARKSNTITIGRAIVTALTVSPLDIHKTDGQKYQWILNGDAREVNRIHAASGFSPLLMHCFVLITNLAARAALTPDSKIVPYLAEGYKVKLEKLRQWSELSEGHESLEQLFAACILKDGVIADAASMTDLTAEAWRVTALIYLQVRVLRLPKSHPTIMDLVSNLAEIIRRMPCVGELFTAQAPFLPVWFLGLIAVNEEHRNIAHNWFHSVINATDCRSSVPPAWKALKRVRIWSDLNLRDYDPTRQGWQSAQHLSPEGTTSYTTSAVVSPTVLSPTVLSPSFLQPSFDHFGQNGHHHQFTEYEQGQARGLNTTVFFDPEAYWEAFDASPLNQREAWWEAVIDNVMKNEGYLCLI